MKRKQKRKNILAVIMALAALVASAKLTVGGNLEPNAPPGPTMKTLDQVEPRIPIPSLPYTVSVPGSYYLSRGLQVDPCAPATGITVEANDVTINLMGYSIIGAGGPPYGIYMNGRSNVQICNGTVRNFGHGIYEASTNAKEHRVINVRVVSNGGKGIWLRGKGHLVKDCTVADNGSDGICVELGCTITANTTYDNQNDGIEAGDGCTLTCNTAFNNGVDGIHTGYGCTVTNNTAHNNQETGIYAGYSCVVIGNTAYYNQTDGILAKKGCTVTSNTARTNQETGIYVDGTGCNVVGNTSSYNQNYGIWLAGNSLVDQNTAYENNQSGGGYANISSCASCTFGLNHAP